MRMPKTPPPFHEVLARTDRASALLRSDIGNLPTGKYLHWDQLRFQPPPEGFTSEEWWAAVKLKRMACRHPLPFADKSKVPFSFSDSGDLYRLLHGIDREASGRIEVPRVDLVNPDERGRFIVNSLIEEAITSSQLEGAATTRRIAKDMLRSGRPPRDDSERMIVNNYRGMEFLRANADEDLSVPMLLELQEMLTEGTLDPIAVGRFRSPSDDVHVVDQRDGTVVRQVALTAHLLKHPDTVYTIKSHRRSHNVTYETARTDLIGLAKLGLVTSRKQRRKLVYTRHPGFEALVRSTANPRQ